jgi:hypothetical protein
MFLKSAPLSPECKPLLKRAMLLLLADLYKKQGDISPKQRQYIHEIVNTLHLDP